MLERRANESAVDYHRRLVYGKMVDRTLADIDYSELASLVYGKELASDEARKRLYGSCATLQLIDAEQEETMDADALTELESKRLELIKERQRFYDQRREYHKLVARTGRKEHLEDRLVEAAKVLDDSVGKLFEDDVHFHDYGNHAVLALTDIHYGMVADNLFNKYNCDICRHRLAYVIDRAIEKILLNNVTTLHVVVLGDIINGAIHVGSRVMSEELVCDQLMQVSELLAQAIGRLSNHVNQLIVYTTYGNHARTIQEKADSVHDDNMERLFPWWLKERLSGCERILVVEGCPEIIYMDVAGHGICAAHGDLDNVKTAPVMLHTLFNKRFGQDVEYVLLGDKHHRESFEELGVEAMLVGSMCGTDDYANGKRLFSTPSQLLLIVNAENGIDGEYRIKCDIE